MFPINKVRFDLPAVGADAFLSTGVLILQPRPRVRRVRLSARKIESLKAQNAYNEIEERRARLAKLSVSVFDAKFLASVGISEDVNK
jgi:hypothetical protein